MNVVLNKLNTIASYAAAISLVIILLVTSVSINCFDSDFYKSEYKTLQTAQDLGMTQKDLNLATNTLLDYLQDKRDNINVEITVQGSKVEAFNSKETAHMVDVRSLYHFAQILRNMAFVILVVSCIYLLVRLKKGAWTVLSINYMKAAILFAIFFIMLAGWAYVDFDAFWTAFHHVAFRNDLWLLNPSTDLMINLFPAAFFSKLVFRIVMMFAIGFIGCFVGAYIYLRYQLKHYQAETQELSHDA